jgi:hypothetical protein
MTALKEFQRLESTGVWRAHPGAQRRDVIVSFGDASLVISDQNGTALTHWSLAAVDRVNPGARPALYAPDPEGTETLEIADDTMEDAVERIRVMVARARPQPGRLRAGLLVGALALVLAILVFLMPRVLVTHTASVLPEATRAEIGKGLLAEIGKVAGSACSTERGDAALGRLATRLLGPDSERIVVLRTGVPPTLHLPGGYLLVHRGLVEDHDSPEVLAGHVLAETLRRDLADPVLPLLDVAGTAATFRLLTSGALPVAAMEAHAATMLTAEPVPVPVDALIARFAEARVSAAPFARAVDVTGEATLRLIEADQAAAQLPMPVLSDADWVSLQGICGE